MNFFDSHAHYTDERFEAETPEGVTKLLQDVFGNDVGYIVNVAVSADNAVECISMASVTDNMFATAGIHPSDSRFYDDIQLEKTRLKSLLSSPKVVAIGEIGLDYHYPDTDKDKQKEFLIMQMELARETHMPVIFHDRDAHGDSMDIVRKFHDVIGVFHCFSGSPEMARELISLGWYVSFTGVITYSNARKVCDAVKVVPDDRIMIETDAPYLAPVPMRGKLNRSDYLKHTAEKMAELRGQSTEHIAKITSDNAKKLFRIV